MRGSVWPRSLFRPGSKVASYIFPSRLQLLRQPVAQDAARARHRDQLNPDATFAFPYGDGYWSKLLNRSY